jgi:hypothetical protein
MAYYDKCEQETLYNFDPVDKHWTVYSTYPPDIKSILSKAEVIRKETDDDGNIIAVTGRAERSQVRFYTR